MDGNRSYNHSLSLASTIVFVSYITYSDWRCIEDYNGRCRFHTQLIQIVMPNFKGMNYCCKFQIVFWIILFILLQLPWCKYYHLYVLHQHTPISQLKCIFINDKFIWTFYITNIRALTIMCFNFWKLFSHFSAQMNLTSFQINCVKGIAIFEKSSENCR